MRKVRVIQHPSGDQWIVESRKGLIFFRFWMYEKAFWGINAKKQAIEYARNLLNPEIIEINAK